MSPMHRMLILATALLLTGCRVELYSGLPEEDANQMLAILMLHHIDADKQKGEGGITLRVEKSQFIAAVGLLNLNGFPRQRYVSADALFPANQLVVSPAQEQQKIIYLKEQRIESMLSQMDGVVRADVTIASPTPMEDGANGDPVSVAVFIKYSPQVNLKAFRTQIINLVEKSIPSVSYDKIGIMMQPAEFRMPTSVAPSLVAPSSVVPSAVVQNRAPFNRTTVPNPITPQTEQADRDKPLPSAVSQAGLSQSGLPQSIKSKMMQFISQWDNHRLTLWVVAHRLWFMGVLGVIILGIVLMLFRSWQVSRR